jgi:hypothetical protein
LFVVHVLFVFFDFSGVCVGVVFGCSLWNGQKGICASTLICFTGEAVFCFTGDAVFCFTGEAVFCFTGDTCLGAPNGQLVAGCADRIAVFCFTGVALLDFTGDAVFCFTGVALLGFVGEAVFSFTGDNFLGTPNGQLVACGADGVAGFTGWFGFTGDALSGLT